jgi:hypothetical protein
VREQAAFEALVALAASERGAVLERPLTDWHTLSARLDDGGLTVAAGATRRIGGRGAPRPWMRLAAGLVIALGGLAVGRVTAARPLPLVGGGGAANTGASGAMVASASSDAAGGIVNVQDALSLMRRAESDYRLGAAFVAAHDTTLHGASGVDRYRQRLAALDRVSDAALAAANEAPADPVINQYLISARTARAVTLQQLNGSLPAGMSLASY